VRRAGDIGPAERHAVRPARERGRLSPVTTETIPRRRSGDVVELILDDHRLFEALLRDLRDSTADRERARQLLADLLIAHGEAEEAEVYPALVRKDAIEDEDAEHGEHEHAEANEALLAVLECGSFGTDEFTDAVEDLATALNHHINEEEQTILDPARTEVSEEVRAELGRKFLELRGKHLDEHAGRVENVRRIVEEAREEGLLDEDDDQDDDD